MNKKKTSGQKGKKTSWNSTKILMVVFGVGFVIFMILSSLGMGWLAGLRPASAGDSVMIDYTIQDNQGMPVLTSNPRIFNATLDQGRLCILTNYLIVPVNSTSGSVVYTFPDATGTAQVGIFSSEYNSLASAIAGMKDGETKVVSFPDKDGLSWNMTIENFQSIGGNYTTARVGDEVLMNFAKNPEINVDDTQPTPDNYYYRIGYIKEKTADGVIIDFGYSQIQLDVLRINNR
ncbi:hypothetical protein J2741_002247 [Methanolinea mesophila]|uniref:hypothetical protein n=1 Tax=Methanolinea mesophila TaxID=547055 RepID=UPI001AE3A739|nr:hypothetical protein [Methanolinea mesophila]MBP1929700.1 hypothetical protein [Methanolinea mesophila]